MFEIETYTTGWPGIRAKLATAEFALADMHDPLEAATELVYARTREWLESEGEGTWEQLADSTVAQKQRQGYADPARPLFATGDLFDSATSAYGPYSVRHVSGHQAVIGVDWSNDGYQIPTLLSEGDESLPARPIFHADDELVGKIATLLEVHVFNPFSAVLV